MGQCLCVQKQRTRADAPPAGRRRLSYREAATYLRSGRITSSCHSYSSTVQTYQLAPPVHELIKHARAALALESFPGVEPETLCCLALALSGGQERLESWCDDIDELRLGLCQMTLPTAQSIARCQDRRAYGVPTRETLNDPVAAFYFAAAALEELSTFDGDDRSVAFAVQAYVSGPKAVCQHHALAELTQEQAQKAKVPPSANTPPPWEQQWANFVKAQRHLLNLALLESQSDAEMDAMHIVQRDETIASIARACHHTVPELYKINPDLPSSVQCGDCIALPRSCMPRMYRTQRGDTWAGIAGWLNMPPARLRARNREAAVVRQGNSFLTSLTNASVLREGQLLEIPGLGNGTSVCSDDSRMEEVPTADMLVPSPRAPPSLTSRAGSLAVMDDLYSAQAGTLVSSEIVRANPAHHSRH